MLNRNDDCRYRHLIPDLKRKTFIVSSLTVFSVDRVFFFKTAFISLRKLPYIPDFLECSLLMNGCSIVSKAFFASVLIT